jgi:hypothetical protein
MPVLKSLSFTVLPKAGYDPVQTRRDNFVAKLEEEKQLPKDPSGRSSGGPRSTACAKPSPSSRPSGPGERRMPPVRS